MIDIRAVAPTFRSFYPFPPSQAAAGVLCGLFSVCFILSFWQTIRHKAWIWFIMVFATGMEAVGYGVRIASARNVSERTTYIAQFCLIVLAPVFMAGVIYVVFGRLVFHVVPPHARTIRCLWVPARWLTPIFVGFDILALVLQIVGAVMITGTQTTDVNAASKRQTGKDIALAGVTVQIVTFGLFSLIAVRFHFKSKSFKADLQRRFTKVEGSPRRFKPNWRAMLHVVNASCILILIRSVYREVDFAVGKGGFVQQYEWYQYVFDAAPMFIVALLYTVYPPGEYVSMRWRQPRSEEAINRADSGNNMDPESFALSPPGRG